MSSLAALVALLHSFLVFLNISAWSNYVKAYVFDNCELSNTEDGLVKFDIVEKIEANKKVSILAIEGAKLIVKVYE